MLLLLFFSSISVYKSHSWNVSQFTAYKHKMRFSLFFCMFLIHATVYFGIKSGQRTTMSIVQEKGERTHFIAGKRWKNYLYEHYASIPWEYQLKWWWFTVSWLSTMLQKKSDVETYDSWFSFEFKHKINKIELQLQSIMYSNEVNHFIHISWIFSQLCISIITTVFYFIFLTIQ